jgi:hypothetical protein
VPDGTESVFDGSQERARSAEGLPFDGSLSRPHMSLVVVVETSEDRNDMIVHTCTSYDPRHVAVFQDYRRNVCVSNCRTGNFQKHMNTIVHRYRRPTLLTDYQDPR